ncbi:hypothetical protein AB1E18_019279 [Capra hircus]
MLLGLPSLMMIACHILLENFTAAVPGHRCWVHILNNDTVSDNDTGTLSLDVLLRISIPLDSNLKPEKCNRFLHPQWQLLHLNGILPHMSGVDTEPCVWLGWDFECDHQSQKSVVQSLVMAGTVVVGGLICGHLSDKVPWTARRSNQSILKEISPGISLEGMILKISSCYSLELCIQMLISFLFSFAFHLSSFHSYLLLVESAQWLIVTNKPDEGLMKLKKVAHRNEMKNAEETLNMKGLRVTMQEEVEAAQTETTVFDLFCTPNLCKRISGSTIPSFAIFMNLQLFGSNIFLFQVIFGTSTVSMLFMFLVGLTILPNTFVGLCPIFSGLVLLLPETRNMTLFDTIQDMENKKYNKEINNSCVCLYKVWQLCYHN